MTKVYFVRHAQPEHAWKEDRTRPLTEEGKNDSKIVLEFFKDKKIDVFIAVLTSGALKLLQIQLLFLEKR